MSFDITFLYAKIFVVIKYNVVFQKKKICDKSEELLTIFIDYFCSSFFYYEIHLSGSLLSKLSARTKSNAIEL